MTLIYWSLVGTLITQKMKELMPIANKIFLEENKTNILEKRD